MNGDSSPIKDSYNRYGYVYCKGINNAAFDNSDAIVNEGTKTQASVGLGDVQGVICDTVMTIYLLAPDPQKM